PAAAPSNPTGVNQITGITSAILFGRETSNDYIYLLGGNGRINRVIRTSFAVDTDGSWPQTISGTGTISGLDAVWYSVDVSGHTRCMLYSYNDSGGAWNIGMYDPSTGTFDHDWLTTVPDLAQGGKFSPSGSMKPHPLCVGPDDLLYFAD